jgi:hypothetical protein
MITGMDIVFVICSTYNLIFKQLELDEIPTIVCTDSFSFYKYLVKLGTTTEKRLMIDIMAFRQSYQNREIFKVRWINRTNNPADSMTKILLNKVFQSFVDINELRIRVEGWVNRT